MIRRPEFYFRNDEYYKQPASWVEKTNKLAANIVFVDEATINEVFGGEDSDGDQSTSDAVSEHGESDVSEQERDIEKENEKNWVIRSREQTALD